MKRFLDAHPGNKIWLRNFVLEELGFDLLEELIVDKDKLELGNVALKIKQRILTECPEHYKNLRKEVNGD